MKQNISNKLFKKKNISKSNFTFRFIIIVFHSTPTKMCINYLKEYFTCLIMSFIYIYQSEIFRKQKLNYIKYVK